MMPSCGMAEANALYGKASMRIIQLVGIRHL